jgi:hypothetical protein
MTVGVSIDDMLATKSVESKPARSAPSGGRSRGDSQVAVMPRAGVPPQFVDMGVDAAKNDVLSSGEHVSVCLVISVGSTGGIGQVVVMPTIAVPPKLMDMTVNTHVVHVLRTLRGKYVRIRVSVDLGIGSTGGISQVAVMPAVTVPPKLVDMIINANIGNMLGSLRFESPPGRAAASFWSPGNGGEIVVMPAFVVPPVLVDIGNDVINNVHVLCALSRERVSDWATGQSDNETGSACQLDVAPAAIAAVVAPKLVEPLAEVDYMLRRKEHIANRGIATVGRSAPCYREVLVMPATGVPPKLMHVIVDGYIGNVTRAVSIESISRGIRESLWCVKQVREIVVMPTHDVSVAARAKQKSRPLRPRDFRPRSITGTLLGSSAAILH